MADTTRGNPWWGRGFWSVIILALFFNLGGRGLNEPDEGRYAEMSRAMLATQDWIVPRLKGVPHLAKPPFVNWAMATSLKVFGFSEFSVRFPSACAALIVLLAVFRLAVRLFDRQTAYLAVVILASQAEFVALSRIAMPDMWLAACVACALLCFWQLRERCLEGRPRGLLVYLFWAILGWGFLIKGPIALAVVALVVISYSLLSRERFLLKYLAPVRGLTLTLAIGLPWYLWLVTQEPKFWDFFVGDELVDRVGRGRGRSQPFYYFLIVLPLAVFPWTVFLFASLRGLRTPARAFALVWLMMPLCLFSLASSKLWHYILPLLPAAALLIAELIRQSGDRLSRVFIGAATLTGPTQAFWFLKSSKLSRCCLVGVTTFAVYLGGQVWASQQELDFGNNASFRRLFEQVQSWDLEGTPIPPGLGPVASWEPPAGDRVLVVSYQFRASSAGFYLLGDRAECIVNYAGSSLWELEVDRQKDPVPGLEELAQLCQQRRVLVLTKSRFLAEVRESCPGLEVVARAGEGDREVLALSNVTD